MSIPRKVYGVTFGIMDGEDDIVDERSLTVLAETAIRAAEIATDLLPGKKSKCYVSEVELLVRSLDAD